MIYKLYASDPRFKSVDFQSGVNVIIADRKEESSDKDSRNGLGKTTFINIMHFCLGADLNKKDLPIEKIEDWIFFMELEIYGEKITASRSISNPNIVKIQGNPTNFPVNVEQDSKDQFQFYKISDWKVLLGMCLFGLPATPKAKYSPTFRNLISYFIRSGIDAYSKPFSYFRGQPAWSIQVHNAFLLGLNWLLASTAQEIKDKSKVVNSLNSAIKFEIEPSKGELEAERIHLQLEFDKDKASLSKFEVHPQYQELQKQANYLTQEIHALSNKNLMLQRKLTRYEESIQSEQVPNESSVELIYKEAGLYFGNALKKTLKEAKTFHKEIIQNRKDFLKVEIEAIKNQAAPLNGKEPRCYEIFLAEKFNWWRRRLFN
ncbi:hypothetical protein [uncultured Legionella sp.]|uniref:hypothetical protein n=1 Tax=uncultured Legionella sp. TaxID=210934 RepID=UPI0026149671|nr:hypothetical protein [uncultured Legionella sp.]